MDRLADLIATDGVRVLVLTVLVVPLFFRRAQSTQRRRVALYRVNVRAPYRRPSGRIRRIFRLVAARLGGMMKRTPRSLRINRWYVPRRSSRTFRHTLTRQRHVAYVRGRWPSGLDNAYLYLSAAAALLVSTALSSIGLKPKEFTNLILVVTLGLLIVALLWEAVTSLYMRRTPPSTVARAVPIALGLIGLSFAFVSTMAVSE